MGIKSVYGIVDWDLQYNGNDYVKVMGKNKRYTKENYIFDPILITAFLLREKLIKREDIGLSEYGKLY